jgi:Ger(x)C family germination protein
MLFFKRVLLKRLLSAFFLFFVLLALAGCSSGQDTNETLYISLIGIDVAEEGKILVTYQFENSREAASAGSDKNSGNSPTKSPTNVITIKGDNFPQTLDFLSGIVSHTPNFAHVRALILGEELAKMGVTEQVTVFSRAQAMRSNTYIIVVNEGTAREFISQAKNTLDTSVARYVEIQMALSSRSNIFLRSNMHQFYSRFKSNSAAAYAALGGVAAKENGDKNIDTKENLKNIYAGSIPREGSVNPVELAGTALFRQDKLVGKLSSNETLWASVLTKDFTSAIIQINDPLTPGYQVGVELKISKPPQLTARLENGKPQIKVHVNFDCFIVNIPSGVRYEKNHRKELEKVIAEYTTQEIKSMLTKTRHLGTDVVGFGYRVRKQFKTYPEFMAIKWDELYTQSEFKVQVTAKIRNTGLMSQTTPINPRGLN